MAHDPASRPLRIAHFSPLPPQRSGIATYCAELLPYLARHAQVDVYVDRTFEIGDGMAQTRLTVRRISEFLDSPALRNQYDMCVYHMGNHPAYHALIYETLIRCPGVVVLHEIDLHAFHRNQAGTVRGRAAYVREMGYSRGTGGTRVARASLAENRLLPPGNYPLFQRIADVSLGLIVHTQHARRQVLAATPRARVARIPLAASLPDTSDSIGPPELLARFPLGTVVLASFGYIASSKRIDVVLRALAQLRPDLSNFRYVLVGQQLPDCDFVPLIAELGLADVVHFTGFVSDSEFEAYLRSIDVGINLRSAPTGGEMSASLMRLLASGKSAIVSNVGGFADLSSECVIKISQNESEVEQLTVTLKRLIADSVLRRKCGDAARRYVRQEFSFDSVARKYLAFIRDCRESIVEERTQSVQPQPAVTQGLLLDG